MKIRLIILAAIILVLSCSEINNDVEIIPDYDAIYLPSSEVDTEVEILGDTDEQLETILGLISETSKANSMGYYFFHSKMYINENGKLEKIGFKKMIPNNFDKEGEVNYKIEELFKKFKNYLSLQKFSPALMEGKPIKSQYLWEGSFRVDSNRKAEVYLGSLAMSALKKNFSINKKDFHEIVEEMPTPIGGISEIARNVVYPEIAKRAGLQGRVFVRAFINEEGMVVASEIIRGIGGGCDQAAITAVVNTKFNPGKKDGKPVKVQVSIPIMFKLN